jgi:hypothetical protein
MERQFIVLLALLYTTIVVLSLANPQDVVGDTTTADTPAASTDGNGKDLAEKLLSDPSAGNATINGFLFCFINSDFQYFFQDGSDAKKGRHNIRWS